jgi:hypothetical protein
MKIDPKEALTKTYKSELKEVKDKASKIELTFDASEDYNESRNLLKRLILRSEEALDSLMTLAQDSEHPRAFEVLAGLLKTTGDLADQLITLQKKRHELDHLNNPEKKQQKNNTNNTAIFVGSTAELQKFLKDQSNDVIDITDEN